MIETLVMPFQFGFMQNAFLIGAILAWMFHSTLAVILLIASFLANGSLEVAGALSFILGINFGGGLPASTATLALPPAGRRLPLANILCRGLAAIACIAFVDRIAPRVEALGLPPVETAVAFHALFNGLTALVFLPLIGPVARLMERLMPDAPEDAGGMTAPRYLDARALATPGDGEKYFGITPQSTAHLTTLCQQKP